MYLSRKAISPQLHSLFAALATCASASPAMLRPQSMSMDPPCSDHACSRPNISIWKVLTSFADLKAQIGNASCRERVGKYVYIWGVAVSVKKKRTQEQYRTT